MRTVAVLAGLFVASVAYADAKWECVKGDGTKVSVTGHKTEAEFQKKCTVQGGTAQKAGETHTHEDGTTH